MSKDINDKYIFRREHNNHSLYINFTFREEILKAFPFFFGVRTKLFKSAYNLFISHLKALRPQLISDICIRCFSNDLPFSEIIKKTGKKSKARQKMSIKKEKKKKLTSAGCSEESTSFDLKAQHFKLSFVCK